MKTYKLIAVLFFALFLVNSVIGADDSVKRIQQLRAELEQLKTDIEKSNVKSNEQLKAELEQLKADIEKSSKKIKYEPQQYVPKTDPSLNNDNYCKILNAYVQSLDNTQWGSYSKQHSNRFKELKSRYEHNQATSKTKNTSQNISEKIENKHEPSPFVSKTDTSPNIPEKLNNKYGNSQNVFRADTSLNSFNVNKSSSQSIWTQSENISQYKYVPKADASLNSVNTHKSRPQFISKIKKGYSQLTSKLSNYWNQARYTPQYYPVHSYVAENGSYYGQISELTGRPKTVYVNAYYRQDGTYVRSHYRSKPER